MSCLCVVSWSNDLAVPRCKQSTLAETASRHLWSTAGLTVLIDKPLQQKCKICILLHRLDLWQVVQRVKGMLIAVIHLLDVRVGHHDIWQELQIIF